MTIILDQYQMLQVWTSDHVKYYCLELRYFDMFHELFEGSCWFVQIRTDQKVPAERAIVLKETDISDAWRRGLKLLVPVKLILNFNFSLELQIN